MWSQSNINNLNYIRKHNKSYEQISGKDENTTRDVPLNCKSGRRVTQRFKARRKEESNVRQNGEEEVFIRNNGVVSETKNHRN
jgi:hypothetical protein